MRRWILFVFAVAGVACSHPESAPSRPRFGALMQEVGRRFELAGRAGSSGRFELAAYEVDELGELFEEDIPHAELPKEDAGVDLLALASTFAKASPAELMKAAQAGDAGAFRGAFGGSRGVQRLPPGVRSRLHRGAHRAGAQRAGPRPEGGDAAAVGRPRRGGSPRSPRGATS
jgi:hypothetical protein